MSNSPLTCYTQSRDGAVILSLSGLIGIGEAETLEREIQNVIQMKPKIVVLDLQRLTFLNSLGIGAFLKLHHAVKPGGGSVRLAQPTDFVLGVIKAGKMQNILPIFPSVDDAIRG